MSVAPRPLFTNQPQLLRRNGLVSASTQLQAQRQASPSRVPLQSVSPKVERLPSRSQDVPIWLRSLLMVQQTSSGLAFCLITATLVVYSWTVYTQQLWSKEFQKLETLQRYERNLTATNETIKNQLAQEAEKPENGLVPANSESNIFLQPAPSPHLPETKTTTQNANPAPLPLGY